MVDLTKHSLRKLHIIDENVKSVIAKLDPRTITTPQFKELARFFSGLFSSKADDIIAADGECEMSDKYTEISDSLKFLFDVKSLKKLADRKPDLFAVMYMREDSFREFADKLLPSLVFVNEKESAKAPEVAEGKITQFPSHEARIIQRQLEAFSAEKS